jgi:hypothetical protein
MSRKSSLRRNDCGGASSALRAAMHQVGSSGFAVGEVPPRAYTPPLPERRNDAPNHYTNNGEAK